MDWLSRTLACRTKYAVSSWQLSNYPIWKRDARSLHSYCWQMLKNVNKRGKLRKGRMITIEWLNIALQCIVHTLRTSDNGNKHTDLLFFSVSVEMSTDFVCFLCTFLSFFLYLSNPCNNKFRWYCRRDNRLWHFILLSSSLAVHHKTRRVWFTIIEVELDYTTYLVGIS